MRVVAKAPGFFQYFREEGEEFEVPEGSKATWFKPVIEDEPERRRGRPPKRQDGDDAGEPG